jgi:hypothetical protein
MKRLIPALGAVAAFVLTATPALGGEPDPGHADLFQHDPGDARIVLDWHFASANYAAWFRSSVESELETYWDDAVGNNSNVPRFDNGGDNSGGGSLVYTSQASSPCTGSTTWLGCNPVGGVRGFAIYVRSIPSISAPTWLFYQRDGTCSDLYDGSPYPDDGFPTSVCFSLMRVTAHEATHLTLLRPHYDTGDDADTFMMGKTPTPNGSPTNWNRRFFLRCDAAAAQLEYGLADPAGHYADCFATTPGDGARGLNPSLTLATATWISRCWNVGLTVGGRLALDDAAAYEDLRNTPLEGRIIRIDRRPLNDTTWTNGLFTAAATDAAGTNWTRSITTSTAGTFVYRATFLTTAGETGVNSSASVQWTVQWTTLGCPS